MSRLRQRAGVCQMYKVHVLFKHSGSEWLPARSSSVTTDKSARNPTALACIHVFSWSIRLCICHPSLWNDGGYHTSGDLSLVKQCFLRWTHIYACGLSICKRDQPRTEAENDQKQTNGPSNLFLYQTSTDFFSCQCSLNNMKSIYLHSIIL